MIPNIWLFSDSRERQTSYFPSNAFMIKNPLLISMCFFHIWVFWGTLITTWYHTWLWTLVCSGRPGPWLWTLVTKSCIGPEHNIYALLFQEVNKQIFKHESFMKVKLIIKSLLKTRMIKQQNLGIFSGTVVIHHIVKLSLIESSSLAQRLD